MCLYIPVRVRGVTLGGGVGRSLGSCGCEIIALILLVSGVRNSSISTPLANAWAWGWVEPTLAGVVSTSTKNRKCTYAARKGVCAYWP